MQNQEHAQYDHFKNDIMHASYMLAAAGIILQEREEAPHVPHEQPFEDEGAPDDDTD